MKHASGAAIDEIGTFASYERRWKPTVICSTTSRNHEAPIPLGYLSFGPIEKIVFFVTSACAKRTGAATRVEQRRREQAR